ncbi:hypothetical protein D6C89_09779 [Aureobasidium pullulans]|nr:hypothetical protein D6C89_09779 [Aureobasidium pullulans]
MSPLIGSVTSLHVIAILLSILLEGMQDYRRSKKEVDVDAESKRVTKPSDLVSPCTRISCSSTKVQGGIWGSRKSKEG